MTAIYRFTQGVRALVAFTQSVDYTLPQRYLSDEMLAVFKQMTPGEQLHSIRVLRAILNQQASTPHDLAVAALMHDCGKVRYPLSVYGKSIAVVMRRALPPLYHYGSERNPQRDVWARPFVVAAYHPLWSGETLRECGGSERATWLVTHHQESVTRWQHHPDCGLLWRLQKADDTH
ncbi:MAG: hypothetical protein AAF787_17990 [Chloroflexota bacterium]